MTTIRRDIKASPVTYVERKWMTRKEAAEYLGVSVSYIKRLNLSMKLNFSKVDGLVFIAVRDIDRLIENNFIQKR